MANLVNSNTPLVATRPKTATEGMCTLNLHLGNSALIICNFESNRIIAQRQIGGVKTIVSQNLAAASGLMKAVHAYVNMLVNMYPLNNISPNRYVAGRSERLCSARAAPSNHVLPLWASYDFPC